MKNMVAVRLFYQDDLEKPWTDIAVAGYFPIVVGGEHAMDNISGRIRTIYLNEKSEVIKVRWNYFGEDHIGYFVERLEG